MGRTRSGASGIASSKATRSIISVARSEEPTYAVWRSVDGTETPPTPRLRSSAGGGWLGSALTTTPAAFLPSPPTRRPSWRRTAASTVAEQLTSCSAFPARVSASSSFCAGRFAASRRPADAAAAYDSPPPPRPPPYW